jgi:amino-acid N-acetyltransferase
MSARVPIASNGSARAALSSPGITPARKAKGPAKAGPYKTRRARAADAEAIQQIIAHFAEQGLLLPRTLDEVQGHLPHFLVYEEKDKVIGCVALEPYGADLAEVRSLAVAPGYEGHGLGARLVRFALAVARRRKIARVFAVTHAPEFFVHLGFTATRRQTLPEKIERDCNTCPKRRKCELVAAIYTVIAERAVLPILNAPTPAA